MWPEASRIRVFMLVPGVEIPHVCAQCDDYPCVKACPSDALSVDQRTGAVLVAREKCTACASCIEACPGRVPFLHPRDNYAVICDLCDGDPQCVKECGGPARFNAIWLVQEASSVSRKLLARPPEEMTEDVATNMYGEQAEELV